MFWQSLLTDFTAIKCASYEEIIQNQCTFNNFSVMGGDVTSNADKPYGVFYLETTESSPFVISNYELFKSIKMIHSESSDFEGPTRNE